MSSFGEKLRDLRLQNNLTQEQLGNIIGKTKHNISKYELDQRQADDETKKLIAKFFNVSLDYLLGIDNNPIPIKHSIKEKEINEKLDDFIEEVEKSNGLMFSGSKMDESTKEVLLKMLRTTKDMAEKMNENNKK